MYDEEAYILAKDKDGLESGELVDDREMKRMEREREKVKAKERREEKRVKRDARRREEKEIEARRRERERAKARERVRDRRDRREYRGASRRERETVRGGGRRRMRERIRDTWYGYAPRGRDRRDDGYSSHGRRRDGYRDRYDDDRYESRHRRGRRR